ncbi:MAG: phosphatidate cytidylyltransferase [Chloroflexaceae bacterium]|jgi:phosphatidate cytidylyltransferase|nr:phosphatidate cytidylyltransferase [Chloroflexaceae bacterium]
MFATDTLTDTLFRTLALLFGVGGVGIFAAVRGNLRRLSQSVLWQRYCSWLGLAAVFLLAVLGGPWGAALLAAGLALLATHEYAALFKLGNAYRAGLLLACLGCLGLALAAPGAGAVIIGLALAVGPGLALLRSRPEELTSGAYTSLGVLYLGGPLAALVALAGLPHGGAWLALAFVGTAVSDVMAFTLGSLLRGPKLCPNLSPGKTWAGFGGNLLGAVLALLLLGPALPPLAPLAWAGLVLLIGGGSLAGDLLESLLKRASGVKDAGTWLPGFGGILDRIDSLLLVLPLVLLVVAW